MTITKRYCAVKHLLLKLQLFSVLNVTSFHDKQQKVLCSTTFVTETATVFDSSQRNQLSDKQQKVLCSTTFVTETATVFDSSQRNQLS